MKFATKRRTYRAIFSLAGPWSLRRRIPTDYGRAEIICHTPVPRLGTLGSSNDVDLNVVFEKRPVLLHCELGPSRRKHDGLILRVASTNTAKFLSVNSLRVARTSSGSRSRALRPDGRRQREGPSEARPPPPRFQNNSGVLPKIGHAVVEVRRAGPRHARAGREQAVPRSDARPKLAADGPADSSASRFIPFVFACGAPLS